GTETASCRACPVAGAEDDEGEGRNSRDAVPPPRVARGRSPPTVAQRRRRFRGAGAGAVGGEVGIAGPWTVNCPRYPCSGVPSTHSKISWQMLRPGHNTTGSGPVFQISSWIGLPANSRSRSVAPKPAWIVGAVTCTPQAQAGQTAFALDPRRQPGA